MSDKILVVLCSCPDKETAEKISLKLIEEKLAACIQISSAVQSLYRWKDAVESETEVQLWIKTTKKNYSSLEERLKELHPYDVPEILGLKAAKALQAYSDWVKAETL